MKVQDNQKSKWSAVADPEGTFNIEALSEKQKEALYLECEKINLDDTAPLTPAQRRLHQQARRRGRPRKGKGAEIVSLSIEKELLRRAEHLAKVQGISRSDVFSRGLRALLAVAGAA